MNPAFQDFFFDVCNAPTGALAARCQETEAALGDLSGNSESSLNPSQTLSGNDSALAGAYARSRQLREQLHEPGTEPATRIDVGPFSLLANGRWSWREFDRTQDEDAERGYEADGYALELGLDRRIDDTRVVGAIVAWERTELEFGAEAAGVAFTPAASTGSIDTESLGLTLYYSWTPTEHRYLDVAAGYALDQLESLRFAVFQESGRQVPQTDATLAGDTEGDQYWASLTVGQEVSAGASSFGIYGGLHASRSRVDGYAEQDLADTGLAMRYEDLERDSLLAFAGARVSRAFTLGPGVFVPQARVEYLHEFEHDTELASARYLLDGGDNRYRFSGEEPDRNFFNASVGVAVVLPRGWLPFLDVETLLGRRELSQVRVTAGLRREF